MKRVLVVAVLLVAFVSSFVLSGLVPLARAATFTVTNTNDSGTGSFRQAILGASPGTARNYRARQNESH